MYSTSGVKSYARETKPVRKTYKNVGVAASIAIGEVVQHLKGEWRKGKKSKLAKALKNPQGGKYYIVFKSEDSGRQQVRLFNKVGPLNQFMDALVEAGGTVVDNGYANNEELKLIKAKIGNPAAKYYVVLRKIAQPDQLILATDDKKEALAYIKSKEGWGDFRLQTARGRKGNPSEPVSPEVEDLSKEWHGRANKDFSEVEETESYEHDLVDLGELEELGIWGSDDSFFLIAFKKDRPVLACDGNGHNLEVIGGDQELDLGDSGIEHNGKVLIPLGYIYKIVYETDKHHLEGSNGYPESYEHYFAEDFYKESIPVDDYEDTMEWFAELFKLEVPHEARESGKLPMAVYNVTDRKILIAGGEYEVTDLGIKD